MIRPEPSSERVHLPVIGGGSLRPDGRRVAIDPADVRGRFTRGRRLAFGLLIAVYAALPWIPIAGHPAVFLDVERRSFYLFGATFNAQDLWLTVVLLLASGLALVVVTTIAGRVWCGWACPQTVFLEGLYRPAQRFIQGSREARLRRRRGPFTPGRVARGIATHTAYVAISLLVAHLFLAYFVSLPALFAMVRDRPAAHPEAFGLIVCTTALLYGNFAWFREQTCVIVCPYGRLQSLLLDADSLIVGYDAVRGEPRGKTKAAEAGDCVDCHRCVVVCPTGIDIRDGLQLDCIACSSCIDACDDVMDRLGRPRGLVRYDSQNGLAGRRRRLIRPRTIAYGVILVALVAGASLALRERPTFEANVLRLPGAPYVIEGGVIRNSYEIHLVNKQARETTFVITPAAVGGVVFVIPLARVTIPPMASRRAPIFVSLPRDRFQEDFSIRLDVRLEETGATRTLAAPFLGP